jgi:hypothetical protein
MYLRYFFLTLGFVAVSASALPTAGNGEDAALAKRFDWFASPAVSSLADEGPTEDEDEATTA